MKLFKEWITLKTVQKQLLKVAILLAVIAAGYYAWHWYSALGAV